MSGPFRSSVEARRAAAEEIARHLYAEHRPRLMSIARRNCDNADDAEEALHDAFAQFLEHFEPNDEAPPLAWLTFYADLCVMPTPGWKCTPWAAIGRIWSA